MPGIPGGGACGHGTRDPAFGIIWECVRIWACEHSRLAFWSCRVLGAYEILHPKQTPNVVQGSEFRVFSA